MHNFSISQLFPDCLKKECDLYPKKHQHILSYQRELFSSQEKFIYWQGGVGAGKTTPIAVYIVSLMLLIENNIGIIFRRDLKLLYKSSWKVIKEVNERIKNLNIFDKKQWLSKDHPCHYESKEQGDYTKITYPNGSVLYAAQSKNILEGLGAEYGVFWIDDAYETSEALLIGDETNAGLFARLRLPCVDNVASGPFKGKSMLRGILSSNPPPGNSYLHRYFSKSPGIRQIGGSSYRHMQSSSLDNIYLPESYVLDIMATHTKEDFERIILGKSVTSYGGIPVYKAFSSRLHVATPKYDPSLPLIRSVDFGYHHPAVIFSHPKKCTKNFTHLIVLYEISQLFNVTTWDLWDEVINITNRIFNETHPALIINCGDKAGYNSSDSNKDKRGPIKIIKEEYFDRDKSVARFLYRGFALAPSLDFINGLFRNKCACGEYKIIIHNRCEVLIEALQGGYKYKKKKDGTYEERPYKDKYFDDVADAFRYGAEHGVKFDTTLLRHIQRVEQRHVRPEPWGWMEAIH